MNYNDKNKKNIDNNMSIRSHLNASLDLEGISVSEDLINRTLEAIKRQSIELNADGKEKADNTVKKVIPWNRYARVFAGVAAAALIIVAGYGLMNNAGKGMKSDSTAYDESAAADRAGGITDTPMMAASDSETDAGFANTAPEAASVDDSAADGSTANGSTTGNMDNGNDSAAAESEQQFTIAADTTLPDEGEGKVGSAGVTSSEAPSASSEQTLKGAAVTVALSFRNIFLSDPAMAQSLTITDEINGASIVLTEQTEILDFYTMMDKHQFTYNTDSSADNNYKVEIAAPGQNEAVYTMTVGSSIIIDYTDKDVASHSIYSAADITALLQDLQDFFTRYNK